jgi:hypothetical protein
MIQHDVTGFRPIVKSSCPVASHYYHENAGVLVAAGYHLHPRGFDHAALSEDMNRIQYRLVAFPARVFSLKGRILPHPAARVLSLAGAISTQ